MHEPVERIVDHNSPAGCAHVFVPELLARAAFAALRDEGQGHSCAALSGIEEIDVPALRSHTWVGDGNEFTPFVLTDDEKFYVAQLASRNAVGRRGDSSALMRGKRHVGVVPLRSDVAFRFFAARMLRPPRNTGPSPQFRARGCLC